MKVIIPVIDNASEKNSIALGFHSTEYACIYNSEDHSYQYVTLTSITQKIGNLSIELKRKGINTIISHQMPVLMLRLFTDCGLRVYRAAGESVSENIQLFENQELRPFPMHATMEMSGCSTSCSSCGSSCN